MGELTDLRKERARDTERQRQNLLEEEKKVEERKGHRHREKQGGGEYPAAA